MDGIRIVTLPAARMAASGNSDLDEFNRWWSALDAKRQDRFFPRDFLAFIPETEKLEWFYALPPGETDNGGYDVVPFPGGIYAAAISRDEDDEDGERVYAEIKKWVEESGIFALDERPGRHTLFHVVTSDEVFAAMGYRQLDIFVPIRTLPR